ncbi:MAG: GNAT family N-acetyltransferase [Piscinibacter sp.]
MSDYRFVPLTADRGPDYLRFFDSRAFTDNPKWSGCYCYFPVHDPAAVTWQNRTAEENRQSVSACVQAGSTSGVLAYFDGQVIGWCHAGPWSMYPMLRDLPEADTASLGVIFCFVVAPEHRGNGVASALLDAACRELRARGLTAVQAKPMRSAQGAAANHLGPLSDVPGGRVRDRAGVAGRRCVRAQIAARARRELTPGSDETTQPPTRHFSMPSHKTFQTQNIEWQAKLQGVQLASFRSRALAFLLDAALVVLLLALPSAWAMTQEWRTGPLTLSFEFGGLVSVVLAVSYFGLSTYLGKGRTIGKYVFGIRVVSLVHSHMSLWHCIERALGYAASSLEAGFGFFQFFTHPNQQTVHDRIAETIVVVSRPRRAS